MAGRAALGVAAPVPLHPLHAFTPVTPPPPHHPYLSLLPHHHRGLVVPPGMGLPSSPMELLALQRLRLSAAAAAGALAGVVMPLQAMPEVHMQARYDKALTHGATTTGSQDTKPSKG